MRPVLVFVGPLSECIEAILDVAIADPMALVIGIRLRVHLTNYFRRVDDELSHR